MFKKTFLIIFILNFPIISQIKIATTLHPFKVIIQKIAGDRGEVIAILKPGFSPHTYEVSPLEVKEVESADVLFYGSENLDGWALNFENKKRIKLINLIPKDSLLLIKTIDGEAVGMDPHFWSDPLIVKLLIIKIMEGLCDMDPDGCDQYETNTISFSSELDNLYERILEKYSVLNGNHVLLSHPFFAYFLKRFDIPILGSIEPIPGKEPTAKDLKKIIGTAIQEKAGAIFIHGQMPERAAEIISESTGIKIFTLDPIGGVAGRISYEELLQYNSEIIFDALK